MGLGQMPVDGRRRADAISSVTPNSNPRQAFRSIRHGRSRDERRSRKNAFAAESTNYLQQNPIDPGITAMNYYKKRFRNRDRHREDHRPPYTTRTQSSRAMRAAPPTIIDIEHARRFVGAFCDESHARRTRPRPPRRNLSQCDEIERHLPRKNAAKPPRRPPRSKPPRRDFPCHRSRRHLAQRIEHHASETKLADASESLHRVTPASARMPKPH